MRKLTAISLMLLFFFNLFGYKALLQYWEMQSNTNMETQLALQQYNEEDLVTVKIPINLPYHTNWEEFESYDGEIDIDGVHYKYVKRRIFNDSLVLLCLPNTEKTRLSTARDELFSLVNDLQKDAANTHSSHAGTSFQFAGGDYICQENEEWKGATESIEVVYYSPATEPLRSVATESPWQPPDVLFTV